WLDDNGADWSTAVSWDLHDHDVAIIDAGTLDVDYATGVMNANMAIAIRPGAGATVVGTDAVNEIRFEPNVQGIFVRVMAGLVSGAGDPAQLTDLNGHLDYSTPTVSQATRDQSIGDPRGIAWTAQGDRGYITGMGSNNVIVVDGSLSRTGRIEVGEGPTGIRIDEDNDRVYVLNKFEGSISVLDSVALSEESRIGYFDPTPLEVKEGRPFLYDTHLTSGLGQAACGSCHIDGRMDQVGWDLGDPQGEVKTFNQVCNFGFGGCEDWHPMKGPMATQTLIGIIDTEPFHWRGDREDLAAFNPAFESLMGDDTQLTSGEMDQFTAFVATLTTPPNPFRDYTGALPTSLNNGNAQTGFTLFTTGNLDVLNCDDCHALPTGTNGELTSANLIQESQSMKIPQLRNMHEKTGFSETGTNNRGFGYIHDGSVFTLFNFLEFPGFNFANDQERRDVDAYMMAFATDTHAGVGVQATLPDNGAADQPASVSDLVSLAAGGTVGLVANGVVDGEARGWYLVDAETFQSDRAAETITTDDLMAAAGSGEEITFTVVPAGSETRIGVDRDEDGYFDRDELDAGSDPADPDSTPKNVLPGDLDGDNQVSTADLLILLAEWGACSDCGDCPADLDGDCQVGTSDLVTLLANWS
ncbi:MAG: YncE family protein, partial [Planctomycetota bacterium]